jgi:NADPH:quinone reductase-like Zn-dependent oxidoreductase
VGQDVTEFKPGDKVYGTCDGSFAEYARTQVGLLARKPANLSFEQAAAIPVSGVCSTAKTELVRGLGADYVVDYSREDFADGAQRYDVIVDIGGNSRLSHLRRALTPRGRLVIVGGETDVRWLAGFDRQLRAIVLSFVVSQKLGILGAKENAADLSALRELLESGQVTPAVDRTYALSEAVAAIRYFQEGNARGKVVIAV